MSPETEAKKYTYFGLSIPACFDESSPCSKTCRPRDPASVSLNQSKPVKGDACVETGGEGHYYVDYEIATGHIDIALLNGTYYVSASRIYRTYPVGLKS
jgi:hypothetical protein